MKLIVTVAGHTVLVDWPDSPTQQLRATADGGAAVGDGGAGASSGAEVEDASIDMREIAPGLYSVVVDGRSLEVVIEPEPEVGTPGAGGVGAPSASAGGGEYLVTVDGAAAIVKVEDPRRRALREAAASGEQRGPAGAVTVAAPMPGRVTRLLVEAGATVERGQPVLLLEAMKMESSITAPHAGTVSEIMVSAGQTVQQRQPLLVIRG